MQIVAGRADDTMTMREVTKHVPSRVVRMAKRVAELKRGRYMVLLTVGDDTIEWTVCPVEKVER